MTAGQAGTICLLLLTIVELLEADPRPNARQAYLGGSLSHRLDLLPCDCDNHGRLHRTEAMSPDRFMVRATAGLASWEACGLERGPKRSSSAVM